MSPELIGSIANSFITLIVGFIALFVYKLSKNDEERSAASIIHEEIKANERIIDRMKTSGYGIENSQPDGLNTNGWERYKHLILKQVDFEEFQQISSFYEKVSVLKDGLKKYNYIWLESITAKACKLQEFLLEYMAQDESKNKIVYEEKKKNLLENAHKETYSFSANAIKNQIDSQLSALSNVSTTVAGNKLKKAKEKKAFYIKFPNFFIIE